MTIDLTKNTTAFGLMSEDERVALEALPRGEVQQYFGSSLWGSAGNGLLIDTSIYRQRPAPPLVVDPDLWRHLPPSFDWIAGDRGGEVWAYEQEPERAQRCWLASEGEMREITGFTSITFTDPERWEEAIVKRPEGV